MTLLRDVGMFVVGIGSGTFLGVILASSEMGMLVNCIAMLIFISGLVLYMVAVAKDID